MIRLKEGLYVNPEDVSEIHVDEGTVKVLVRMRAGHTHIVGFDYGKSVWDTQRRLVAEVEAGVSAACRRCPPNGDASLAKAY